MWAPAPTQVPPVGAAAAAPTRGAAAQPLARRVFISHTGADEGAKVFAASILKPALEAAGLRTFIDFRDLPPGCEWPAELVDAAARSAVFVAVLSKTYTRRFWCMLELDAALHGAPGQAREGAPLVIPVFYDSPADISQAGEVRRHWEERLAALAGDEDAVPADRRGWVRPQRWAQNVGDADRRLQNVRRWVAPSDVDGAALRRMPPAAKDAEWQVARRVVAAALQEARPLLAVPEDLFGFEEQEALLIAELAVPDPNRLGLWLYGMGGSGKTTMAKLLFNSMSRTIPKAAFVDLDTDDVQGRQTQQKLAGALRSLGITDVHSTATAAQLLMRLRELVEAERVLLVVDNVWTADQLDGLLPTRFHPGSRLVVTSRSSELGESAHYRALATKLLHHQLELLRQQASQQLFRGCTGPLPAGAATAELAKLEEAVIAACSCLPLALKIAGGQLWQEANPAVWRAVLASLQGGAHLPSASTEDKMRGVLTASFNALSLEAQNMILDSATFLYGFTVDTALRLWGAWWGAAEACWKELLRRSLVGVDDKGRLRVHDVIRSAAGAILRDPEFATPHGHRFYGSRLWQQGDGQLLDCSQGCREPLVALSLWETQGDAPPGLGALDLRELRFLHAGGNTAAFLLSKAACLKSAKLLFCTAREMPLTKLPGAGWQLPAFVQKLMPRGQREVSQWGSALRHLSLKRCQELRLPESFGDLSALQHLDLEWCSQVRSLPKSFGRLSALQHLNLSLCGQLRSLPESFGQLSALQHLDLRYCEKLRSLPESFGLLSALQHLDLGDCSQLTSLPELFGELSALQHLDLSDCNQLTSLPESFWQLSALQHLDLSDCNQLTSLPESFGRLSALQHLDLSECSHLTSLPESFGRLSVLQNLDISDCRQLSSLPESFGELSALQHLDLRWCRELTSLPESFGELSALQQLDLSDSSQLGSLPESFKQLTETIVCLGGSYGQAKGLGAGVLVTPVVAPAGSWISKWVVGTDHDGGVKLVQGVLQDGTALAPLVCRKCNTAMMVEVVPEGSDRFVAVTGRAGWWLDAFMGVGSANGGDAWTFTCTPGSCVVGYRGVAAEHYVGSIAFVQRCDPAMPQCQ